MVISFIKCDRILTLSNITINVIETVINSIVLTNHPDQCSQFGKPIIFIASFNCFSFSVAINFTVLIVEYTKLNIITNGTIASKPSSKISKMNFGYGNRYKRNIAISILLLFSSDLIFNRVHTCK